MNQFTHQLRETIHFIDKQTCQLLIKSHESNELHMLIQFNFMLFIEKCEHIRTLFRKALNKSRTLLPW